MAYDAEEDARVIRHGQARRATQFIPPNVSGYDAKIDKPARRDVAGARALLDKFGYTDRDGDGLREAPDGQPLTLRFSSRRTRWRVSRTSCCSAISRDRLARRIRQAEMARSAQGGAARTAAGMASGEHQRDSRGFRIPWPALWGERGIFQPDAFQTSRVRRSLRARRALPDGPERERLIRRMTDLIDIYEPWAVTIYRYENALVQPWLLGYKYNPIQQHPWQYLDIDVARRASAVK
jgi:ABC-type transport system substrate-binding protein